METDEKLMTGEESLKIITEMINRTKVNFSQSIFHLQFWGWLVLACSLSDYLLSRFTALESPWYVWLLTIPGAFISMAYGFIKGRKANVCTYGDMINMWTWVGFLVSIIILFILMKDRLGSISPFILILTGLPTFISGFIIRFKPLIIGGISMWILSLAARFGGPEIAPLAVPVAMITGYLIPAFILRRKNRHDAV